jgi:tetratricopeptide (TPR) repeat protein
MEHTAVEEKPTALVYVSALGRIAFTTICYWVVGLTPEENHGTKGAAWARIRCYRWAAWHFRQYLKHAESSWARAGLAWCYAQLGIIESAVEHYRLAYARNKDPEIAMYLSCTEAELGNLEEAQRLFEEASARRSDFGSEALAKLDELDSWLRAVAPRPAKEGEPIETAKESQASLSSRNDAGAASFTGSPTPE